MRGIAAPPSNYPIFFPRTSFPEQKRREGRERINTPRFHFVNTGKINPAESWTDALPVTRLPSRTAGQQNAPGAAGAPQPAHFPPEDTPVAPLRRPGPRTPLRPLRPAAMLAPAALTSARSASRSFIPAAPQLLAECRARGSARPSPPARSSRRSRRRPAQAGPSARAPPSFRGAWGGGCDPSPHDVSTNRSPRRSAHPPPVPRSDATRPRACGLRAPGGARRTGKPALALTRRAGDAGREGICGCASGGGGVVAWGEWAGKRTCVCRGARGCTVLQ